MGGERRGGGKGEEGGRGKNWREKEENFARRAAPLGEEGDKGRDPSL